MPYILWDNIPRGTQISCPHIERSCTSAFYADRRLGVSEAIRTAAGAIHLFTGNAIGAKGDMASRSLTVQLAVDRADPENRDFKHPDPVAWTDAHRVEILRAFYTILLGNPDAEGEAQRGDADAVQDVVAAGRLRGRACHRARQFECQPQLPGPVPRAGRIDDELSSLAEVLEAMAARWPGVFAAADVAAVMNDILERHLALTLREFLYPGATQAPPRVSVRSVGRLLKRFVDAPVWSGKRSSVCAGRRKTGKLAR